MAKAKKRRTSKNVRTRKKTDSTITKVSQKNKNFNTMIAGAIVLVALLVAAFYFGNLSKSSQSSNSIQPTPTTTSSTSNSIVAGGSCEKDSQCFITHCKGQGKSCVNTTQLSIYSKNCDKYLDWMIDLKNTTQCGCVQNACRMS